MVSLPQRLSLFPYTTLFRSDGGPLSALGARARTRFSGPPSDAVRCGHDLFGRGIEHPGGDLGGRLGKTADRKSTRLNSSHVKISYAVFCLKKKNNLTYFQ